MAGMLRGMSRWWLAVPIVLIAPVLAVAAGGSTALQAIYMHIATNEPTSFVVLDIGDQRYGFDHNVYIALQPDAVPMRLLYPTLLAAGVFLLVVAAWWTRGPIPQPTECWSDISVPQWMVDAQGYDGGCVLVYPSDAAPKGANWTLVCPDGGYCNLESE